MSFLDEINKMSLEDVYDKEMKGEVESFNRHIQENVKRIQTECLRDSKVKRVYEGYYHTVGLSVHLLLSPFLSLEDYNGCPTISNQRDYDDSRCNKHLRRFSSFDECQRYAQRFGKVLSDLGFSHYKVQTVKAYDCFLRTKAGVFFDKHYESYKETYIIYVSIKW